MTTSPSTGRNEERVSKAHTALRIFGYVVLLLMLVAIVYVIWISIINWSSIGV